MEHRREHSEEHLQKEDLAGCGILALAILFSVAALFRLTYSYYVTLIILVAVVIVRRRRILRLLSRARMSWVALHVALTILTLVIAFGVLEFGIRQWHSTGLHGGFVGYCDHPQRAIALKPNVVTQHFFEGLDGKWSSILAATSEFGIRDHHLLTEQGDSELRVFMLGDSYTFGWGLTDEETVPVLLEGNLRQRRPGAEIIVINGGVPGYGPWQELSLLKEIGAQMAPDLVVLQIFIGNDIDDTLYRMGKRSRAYNREWHRTLAYFEYREVWQVRVDRWLRSNSALYYLYGHPWGVPTLWKRIHFAPPLSVPELGPSELRPFYAEPYLAHWYPELNEGWDAMKSDVEAILEETTRLGADLLVFLVPGPITMIDESWNLVLSGSSEKYDRQKEEELAYELCGIKGLRCLLIFDDVRESSDPRELYYPKDGHLTRKGSRVVAQALTDSVLDSLDF